MRFVAGRAAVADCPDSYGKDASGADAYWPGRRGEASAERQSRGEDAGGADADWLGPPLRRSAERQRRCRMPMPPAARKENGLPLVGADDFGNVDEVVCNTLGIAGHL